MNDLEQINVGNFLYLDPTGIMKFSLIFDAWIFDYLYIDTELKIK